MGWTIKYFPKKLLGHEIFRPMFSWAKNFFFEKFAKPFGPPPPTYLMHALLVIPDAKHEQAEKGRL